MKTFVLDCLFDLVNESDLLDVREIRTEGNVLYFTLFDGTKWTVTVKEISDCQEKSLDKRADFVYTGQAVK